MASRYFGSMMIARCMGGERELPMNEIETCREALEYYMESASNLFYYMDYGHKVWCHNNEKLAAIDAALAWLATVEAAQMPQPDWASAPEWAMWWAMDADGAPYWFENKPELHLSTWQPAIGQGRYCESDRKSNDDWRLALQRRPQEDK